MPSSPPSDLGLAANSIAYHPTERELREFADAMSQARQTEFGNVNVQTRVVSRSKASTHVVTDRPEEHSDQTIDREEGARLAALQDDYIRGQDMMVETPTPVTEKQLRELHIRLRNPNPETK